MCMIETKIYYSPSGTEWEREIAHPCKRAMSNRLCTDVEHRTTRAEIVERRQSSSSRRPARQEAGSSDIKNHGAGKAPLRHLVTPAEGTTAYRDRPSSPALSTSSSCSEMFPAAPSPPPPAYRHLHIGTTNVSSRALPMMSGGLGSGDGMPPSQPSYDFVNDIEQADIDSLPPPLPKFTADRGKPGSGSRDKCRKVSIELPAGREYKAPTLSAPPLRRKSISIGHKRVDSGKAFLATDRDHIHDQDRRAADAEEQARYREQQSRQRYEAHMEGRQRRQEADEDARQLRNERIDESQADHDELISSMLRDPYEQVPPRQRRESLSGYRAAAERQRLADAAAESARRKAERVQRAEQVERDRERRVQAELHSADRERHEAEVRRHSRDWALQRRHEDGLMQTYQPRRRSYGMPIIHYDDPPSGERTSAQHVRGQEIIATERARFAREELAMVMNPRTLDDPFAHERSPRDDVEAEAARLSRMRRYRDDRRRNLDI